MTDQGNREHPSTEKGKEGYRRMSGPAVIRERVERDPVDVALGDILTGTPDDTDGDATTFPQPRRATATPGPGDSDSLERHDTPATGPGDTTSLQGDTTTSRQATPPRQATGHDAATGDSAATEAAAAPPAPGDMTPTKGDQKVRTRKAGRKKKGQKRVESTDEPTQPEAMKSASFSMPPDLLTRMRAAQYHTQTKPDGHRNLSGMVRELVTAEILRLEAEYNDGRPFPKVEGALTSGPSMEGARRGAMLRSLQARKRREAREAGSDET